MVQRQKEKNRIYVWTEQVTLKKKNLVLRHTTPNSLDH